MNKERATVFDVAEFVLRRVGTISTMKLQKLCYYCQAWELAWEGVPLFDEDFHAWANGPVCKELFAKHKGEFSVSPGFFGGSNHEFEAREIENMDSVIGFYKDMSPWDLSFLTHKEQPWKNARGNTPLGEPGDNLITKDSMQDYYGGLAG